MVGDDSVPSLIITDPELLKDVFVCEFWSFDAKRKTLVAHIKERKVSCHTS